MSSFDRPSIVMQALTMPVLDSVLKDKLVKESFYLFFGNGLANLCNYFFQFYMSRRLTHEAFASMNSLMSLMVITSVPAVSISLIVARYVSAFKAADAYGMVRTFTIRFLKRTTQYGFFIFCPLLIISPWVSSYLKLDSAYPVIIMFTALFATFALPVNIGTCQGLQKFIQMGAMIASMGFSKLILGVILIHAGFMLNGAMISILISVLFPLLMSFLFLKELPRSSQPEISLSINRSDFIRYSMPIVLSSLSIVILVNLDLICVKHFFTPEEASIYSSVAVLGRTVFYFPGVIVMTLFPFVSESHARDQDSWPILVKAVTMTAVLGGAGLVVLAGFPSFTLSLLFGRSFSNGAPMLRLFSLAMFFMALTNIFAKYMLAVEKMRFIAILLISCIFEFILISLFHSSLYSILFTLVLIAASVCLLMGFEAYRIHYKTGLKRSYLIPEEKPIRSKRPSFSFMRSANPIGKNLQ
jgi:O-antigen/teichoic acid export membrane protein